MPSPPITIRASLRWPSTGGRAFSTAWMHRRRASLNEVVWCTWRVASGRPATSPAVSWGSSRRARPRPAAGFTTSVRVGPS